MDFEMIDYIYFTKNISFRYILVFSGPSRRIFVICAKTGAKLCFPVLMTLFPFLFVLGMTIAATITSNMGYATSTGFGALMMLLVMLLILIMILRHVWSPCQVAIGWYQPDNEEFNDSHTQWGTNGLQGNALFYRQWYQVCCNIRAARSIIRFTPDDKLHLLQQHPWISILEYNNRKGNYTKSKNRIQ